MMDTLLLRRRYLEREMSFQENKKFDFVSYKRVIVIWLCGRCS